LEHKNGENEEKRKKEKTKKEKSKENVCINTTVKLRHSVTKTL